MSPTISSSESQLVSIFTSLVAASILFGVTSVQVIFYYTIYARDPLRLKLLVALLWALDCVQLVLTANMQYNYLVPKDDHLVVESIVSKNYLSLISDYFITLLIMFVVELSLTARIWTISKNNRILAGYLVLMMLLQLAVGVAYGVRMIQNINKPQDNFLVFIVFGCTEVIQLSITISLVCFLHNGRTGIKTTDKMILYLILYTVITTVAISVAALSSILLQVIIPEWGYRNFYIMIVISKLYTNGFLGTLNARRFIRERSRDTTVIQTQNVTEGRLHENSAQGTFGISFEVRGESQSTKLPQ